jgi:magnesium-transporting ATPase (P-type)
LADEGYRVLAMAVRCGERRRLDDDPGSDLTFAGMQGMEDPVRPEAVEAVKAARQAGIRVLMLTGDHARTAQAIHASVKRSCSARNPVRRGPPTADRFHTGSR